MKPNRSFPIASPGVPAICGFLLATCGTLSAVTIDGNASSGESYVTLGATQNLPSYIDNSNVLASIRYVKEPNTLNLGICGRATNTAILLFIDAVPGGVNRITPNLIAPQSGGEHEFINKLALNETTGLTFESGFTPETAIRIFGNDAGMNTADVSRFNLVTGTHTYVGESHAAVVSEGPIRQLRTVWENVGSGSGINGYSSHRKGVEMNLNLAALGVIGTGQTVKLMGIMVSGMLQEDPELPTSPTYIEGSNQALAPVSAFMADINQFDFGSEPGIQTLSITVDGLAPGGDEDNDGLLNGVETNTGVFVSASNTGSNPLVQDSDGDGFPDGAEVTGSPTLGLGFVSDPNFWNYTNLAVPGTFNKPTPFNYNTALNNPATAMVRESNSLTGQFRWILDYKFSASEIGPIAYKFNSGYTADIQWSGGPTPGITVAGTGSNLSGEVPASGIHRFSFDQKTLAYSFARTVFADAAAFLAAYGLAAGSDSDGDGIPNQEEFTANTDPSNADSDGDGQNDLIDATPLGSGSGYEDWADTITGDPARTADPDHDQFTNFQEYLFGTSPNAPTGTLTPLERSGGNLVIRWLQRGGPAYQLQESDSLTANPWPASSASVSTDPDQSGVPAGYTRKTASVPVGQPVKFLRIVATE